MLIKDRDYQGLKVELLTPVFIGSGDTLDGFSYTIQQKETGEYELIYMDLDNWLVHSSHKEQANTLLQGNNYLEIRKFIQKNFNADRFALARYPVEKSIGKKFVNEIVQEGSRNRLLIDAALKNSLSHRLLIPGSSIKGSIRTALMDYLDQKYCTPGPVQTAGKVVAESLFGDIADNALKALKIGDFEVPFASGRVVGAQEMKKNPDKESTPKNNCEVVWPDHQIKPASNWVLGFGKDSSGKINIKHKESIDQQKLFNIANVYFKKRFDTEWDKFYAQDHFQEVREILEPIKGRIEQLNMDSEMLIRVGHYSHVEAVTITRNKPQERFSKGKPLGHGKTRTLANGLFPFGWVILSIANEKDVIEYRKCLDQEYQTSKTQRENNLIRLKEKKAKRKHVEREEREQAAAHEAKKARLQEEARQKEEAEAKRRESLGWHGRLLEDLKANPSGKIGEAQREFRANKADIENSKAIAGELLEIAEKLFGRRPKQYQQDFLNELKETLGISESKEYQIKAVWPSEAKELEKWASGYDLSTLAKEQLVALKTVASSFKRNAFSDIKFQKNFKRDVDKTLKNKR